MHKKSLTAEQIGVLETVRDTVNLEEVAPDLVDDYEEIISQEKKLLEESEGEDSPPANDDAEGRAESKSEPVQAKEPIAQKAPVTHTEFEALSKLVKDGFVGVQKQFAKIQEEKYEPKISSKKFEAPLFLSNKAKLQNLINATKKDPYETAQPGDRRYGCSSDSF